MYKKITLIFILLLIPLTINATNLGNQNGIPSMQVPTEPIILEQSPPIINSPINNEINQPVSQITQMPTNKQAPSEQIMELEKLNNEYNTNGIKPGEDSFDELTPQGKILNNGGFATKSLKESAIEGEQDTLSLTRFSVVTTVISIIFSIIVVIIAIINYDFNLFLPITIIIFSILFIIFSVKSTICANASHKAYVDVIKLIENQEYLTNNFIDYTKQIILKDIDTTTQENINLWLTNISYDNISREMLSQVIAEKYKLAFINGQMYSMDTFIKKEIDIFNDTIDNHINK